MDLRHTPADKRTAEKNKRITNLRRLNFAQFALV